MSIISKLLLLFSFFLLLFNGSAASFILFNERLGMLFGYGLFVFSCLVGALFASIAEEPGTTRKFYCKYCMIGNLIVAFFPLYFHFVAETIFPTILSLLL